jgi:hypothetical protein
MIEQRVLGTSVAVPLELAMHTFQQGSWPWLFDMLMRRIEAERIVPVDPVLLFWPADPRHNEPTLADADTGALPERLFNPLFFTIRLVSRKDGEAIWRGWPMTADWKFKDALPPEPEQVEEPLKPMTWEAQSGRRKSPFDAG